MSKQNNEYNNFIKHFKIWNDMNLNITFWPTMPGLDVCDVIISSKDKNSKKDKKTLPLYCQYNFVKDEINGFYYVI